MGKRDINAFRERFNRWKNGELVYDKGRVLQEIVVTPEANYTSIGKFNPNKYPVVSSKDEGLDDWFKSNTDVTGMAIGGGENGIDGQRRIVHNPYLINMENTDSKWKALDKIEAVRHYMSESNYYPTFNLTNELKHLQKTLYKNTPYGKDDIAFKKSIISRLVVGDESNIGTPTPQQLKAAKKFIYPRYKDDKSVSDAASTVAQRLRDRMYRTVSPTGYKIDQIKNFIKNGTREYEDINTEALFGKYTGQDSIIGDIYKFALLEMPIPGRKLSSKLLRDIGQEGYENLRKAAVSDLVKPSSVESGAYELVYPELVDIPNQVPNKMQLHNHPLGTYTIKPGRDNKGEYTEYTDTWDINPFKGVSSSDDDFFSKHTFGLEKYEDIVPFGLPFKIKGRVYNQKSYEDSIRIDHSKKKNYKDGKDSNRYNHPETFLGSVTRAITGSAKAGRTADIISATALLFPQGMLLSALDFGRDANRAFHGENGAKLDMVLDAASMLPFVSKPGLKTIRAKSFMDALKLAYNRSLLSVRIPINAMIASAIGADYVNDTLGADQTTYKNGKDSDIYIKPSHRGRLTALKKRTGKSEAELYRTGGPDVRKMITFARNARKWHHN